MSSVNLGAPGPLQEVPVKDLELATRWQRLKSFVADAILIGLICRVLVFLVSSPLPIDPNLPPIALKALSFAIQIGVSLIYFPLFTAMWSATPGKRFFGIKVLSDDLKPMTVSSALLREWPAKWFSSLLLGHLWIFFNPKKKAAWDYLASTVVVRA